MRTLAVFAGIVSACVIVRAQNSAAPGDLAGTWVLDVSKSHTDTVTKPVAPGSMQIQEPTKKRDVRPVYPPDALAAKIGGAPVLEAIIDRDGYIADLRVIRSDPRFDQAATAAVWQWEYTPTMVNGERREVSMTTIVTFSVGGGPSQRVNSTPAPQLPFKAFGTGLGLGRPITEFSIAQDAQKIVATRTLGGESHKVTYAPGQKAVTNKIKNYGSAKDNAYTYTSRWEDGKLATEIVWVGPQGLRTAKEVIARTGETLTMTTSRPDTATAGDAFTQTLVYNRKQ